MVVKVCTLITVNNRDRSTITEKYKTIYVLPSTCSAIESKIKHYLSVSKKLKVMKRQANVVIQP